jgi:hypothetical protein
MDNNLAQTSDRQHDKRMQQAVGQVASSKQRQAGSPHKQVASSSGKSKQRQAIGLKQAS